MERGKILIVDDEPLMQDFLLEALSRRKYQVDLADNGTTALHKIKAGKYDLIITDIRMPDVSGMEILKTAKGISPDMGVIMITAYGTIKNAVEAMKQGAYDYITKPFSVDEIELVVDKFFEYRRLVDENKYLRSELGRKYGVDNIIGKSPKMRKIFETIDMVAQSKATVLIQGPSGTGKELIARAIHFKSPRRNKPFIKTNCAALPEGLVESELFGHEKGAFTGAIKTTKGRFELANGGTLLLDEIGEMGPNLQAKLLRVLQEGEFEKVGSSETVKVDVRIIATTNKDLKKEVEKGNFREDLYYRLNVVPIYLPPLRERKEDIPLLVEHFLRKYSEENGKLIEGISRDALQILIDYDWPGNVRELENVIERAVVMSKEKVLSPKHFSFGDFEAVPQPQRLDLTKNKTLKDLEREFILKTLAEQGGNRSKTAEILGISVRTLRNKLKEYKKEGYFSEKNP